MDINWIPEVRAKLLTRTHTLQRVDSYYPGQTSDTLYRGPLKETWYVLRGSNVKHGEYMMYDECGNVIKHVRYELGIPVETITTNYTHIRHVFLVGISVALVAVVSVRYYLKNYGTRM